MKMSLEIRLFLIRHRNLIIFIFLFFIGLIFFVQDLNNLAEEKYGEKEQTYISNEQKGDIENNVFNNTLEKDKENEENIELINNFIYYCKEEEKEKAYDMLSVDCKKDKYQTLDVFYLNYLKPMFNNMYDVEVVYTGEVQNTYNIIFSENILHAGKVEELEEITHYYIVEKTILDNEKKIYISKGEER